MVKLDKIYTRGGDSGLTSLGDGERVKKDSLRVECYGEVDEINSVIGVVNCYCSNQLKKNLSRFRMSSLILERFCVCQKQKITTNQ